MGRQVNNADESSLVWRKSFFSESGSCVEVADAGSFILIRDSKNAKSCVLQVSFPAWSRFLALVSEDRLAVD